MYNNNPDLTMQNEGFTTLHKHTINTFMWMTLGIAVTAVIAYLVSMAGIEKFLIFGGWTPMAFLFIQIGVVFALVSRIHKMEVSSARTLFLVYAIITGIVFSFIASMYDVGSIMLAFGTTAVYFGALTFIGYTTKFDLSRIFPILFVGLLVLIGFNIFAFFFNIDGMSRLTCSLGLLIFSGLTAYDTQKMKALYMANQGNEQALKTLSIYSAFDLYLDFINIFLYILRILGNSRD